ncbi:MAG: GrpB family protein [Gammaproteobacteria bacterium]
MGRTVEIVDYDPAWPELYERGAVAIRGALAGLRLQCVHIGSTAIPGLSAKAVIDILLAVESLNELSARESGLQGLGYSAHGEFGIPGRRYYTKVGEQRTHHLHAFEFGAPEVARHIGFRDFLRESGRDAEAYAALKIRLAQQFRDDPHGYSDAKSAFIQSIDERARDRYLPKLG